MVSKNKAKKTEQQELQEEAMTEWMARGFNIQDFTMDKMMALWMDEDGIGDDEGGEDSLSAKQELMKGFNVLAPVVTQVKDMAVKVAEVAKVEATKAIKVARKYAELPPLQRRRLLREHVVHVHEMDLQSRKYTIIRERVGTEWKETQISEQELKFGLKKRNQHKAPLLKRLRDMKTDADKRQREEELYEIEQRRRTRKEAEEVERKRTREEQEKAIDDQSIRRRKLNKTFWQKHYETAKEYAQVHSLARNHTEKQGVDENLQRMNAEIAEMNGDHGEDDDCIGKGAAHLVGVYKTSLRAGEWNSAIDGGDQYGMDEHTVGIFSAQGFQAENEELRNEMLEVESKLLMLHEKFGQINQVKANLVDDRMTVRERKQKLLSEIKQVNHENEELAQLLAGPPRRDPSEDDKAQFHLLVTRRAQYTKQLNDLNAREVNIQSRMRITEESAVALLPKLEETQRYEAELRGRLAIIDQRQNDLPIIIGRSIQRDGNQFSHDSVPRERVTIPVANPKHLLAETTMATKLELLKSAAIPVKEHYRRVKQLSIEDWKTREGKAHQEQDLEVTKTRLANVRNRLVEQRKDGLRADLMQAILRYHKGSQKLRKCVFPLKGQFEWWQSHDRKRSSGLTFDGEMNTVFFGKSAQLRGSVRLPKRCLYRISLQILVPGLVSKDISQQLRAWTPARHGDSNQTQSCSKASEAVIFYIGSDYDSLQEHQFRDPTGKVVQEGWLTFEFYGNRLCFSFEYSKSTSSSRAHDSTYHFALGNAATYEERIYDLREEDSRIRLLQREDHIVSELVKTIRMQSKKTNSERCADLLEELIEVETSKSKNWDSHMLHGHNQRFKRVEYARMLRVEIKKELAHQINEEIRQRRRCVSKFDEQTFDTQATAHNPDQEYRRDVSRLNFLARKSELAIPQYQTMKGTLGTYCSFKTQQNTKHINEGNTNRSHALVTGIRLEWSEERTKLNTMHKLGKPDRLCATHRTDLPLYEWRIVETENVVFLEGACAETLRSNRIENAAIQLLTNKKETEIGQLRRETEQIMFDELKAAEREEWEDQLLRKQKEQDIKRRERQFYAEAVRATTYNEQISSQMEALAERRIKAIDQQRLVAISTTETTNEFESSSFSKVLRDVKHEYAKQFTEGRIALVNKTWERRQKRLEENRARDRRERLFRIQQEKRLVDAITVSSDQECVSRELTHDAQLDLHKRLLIPNFDRAIQGTFACEHRVVKAWGSKYGSGTRCKQCDKEMATVSDDPDHARGADVQLDRDVEQHRGHTTGHASTLRLRDKTHFDRVERERLRLEKERREMEVSEAMLYDLAKPKAIAQFDYRHGRNRDLDTTDVSASDPIYPRLTQDMHHAYFQDEILFHGRLKNYHFRVNQLNDVHARTTTQLALQRSFLTNVQSENEFVLAKLPLVERDHAQAAALIAEDMAAARRLDLAVKTVSTTKRDREKAYHALEGVEEESEFAEFHAPSLIECSSTMAQIVERMSQKSIDIKTQLQAAHQSLAVATKSRDGTENMMSRLYYRERGSRVRTRFGFAIIKYYRDEDSFLVLEPEGWEATMYIPIDEIIALESLARESEVEMMTAEEISVKSFTAAEQIMEKKERALMQVEEKETRKLVEWRRQQEVDELNMRAQVCCLELNEQFEYETVRRQKLLRVAGDHAKRLHKIARVSLKRHPTKGRAPRVSRIDSILVTRGSEKRLAMEAIEKAVLQCDKNLRLGFEKTRDTAYTIDLSDSIYELSLVAVMRDICEEVLKDDSVVNSIVSQRYNHAIVGLYGSETEIISSVVSLSLDRLWITRKWKYKCMATVWEAERIKLEALRLEIARRKECLRVEEEERKRLVARRKEMLAEERLCRSFYLSEMIWCMRERKGMATAEMEMREYIRQLEVEAAKAKYAKMVEDRNKANDKEARRLEIKLGKNEKHRLHREWAQIRLEDDLAERIREEERSKAEAEALERQFDQYLIQQSIEGKLAAEREASMIADRLREAQIIAAERRAEFEAQLVTERMMATVETYHHITHAELAWMESVERASYWQNQTAQLESNLTKMNIDLARILSEKDHVVADATEKREHAEICKKNAQEADTALRKALVNEELCKNAYGKIHFINSTMDSAVLHGRPQRFRTKYLRDQLQTRYFYLLTESIIRRAIVECSEREAARLDMKLEENCAERAFKMKEIGVLQRQRRREYRMRMRRAELGKLMFGGFQKLILKARFQQWVHLWSTRISIRASFQLKHGLLMQQNRIRTLEPKGRSDRDDRSGRVESEIHTKLTVLHTHQKRRVVCRLCKKEYTEEQNNRFACSYHPGTYELACISSCSTRQGASVEKDTTILKSISSACMMHREKRWLCCDITDEGRYGDNGCMTRYHLPVRANPALAQLVSNKTEEEHKLFAQVDQRLSELQSRNVVGQANQATKAAVNRIKQGLNDKRASAAKYFTLDRR